MLVWAVNTKPTIENPFVAHLMGSLGSSAPRQPIEAYVTGMLADLDACVAELQTRWILPEIPGEQVI